MTWHKQRILKVVSLRTEPNRQSGITGDGKWEWSGFEVLTDELLDENGNWKPVKLALIPKAKK